MLERDEQVVKRRPRGDHMQSVVHHEHEEQSARGEDAHPVVGDKRHDVAVEVPGALQVPADVFDLCRYTRDVVEPVQRRFSGVVGFDVAFAAPWLGDVSRLTGPPFVDEGSSPGLRRN